MNVKSLIVLILGILCLAGLMQFGYSEIMDKHDDVEEPVYRITFRINSKSRDQFLDEIRKFAERNEFAIRIAPTKPDNSSVLIQLWREDVKIVGVTPFEPDEYRIGVYNNDDIPVRSEVLDLLKSELKKTVADLDGAKYIEK